MTSRWHAVVLVGLLGASITACSDDGPGEGEARLEVDGEATVERANGDRETVADSTDLDSGDRVSMVEGVAVMRLRGGTTFELRKGLDDAADTTVVMGERPVLEAGDLLVTTPGSTEVEADGTAVEVQEGAARLSRAFGMSASAYDADLALDSAGVPTEVPALRRVSVPDLGRPRPPRPVDYDDEDPWDRRYLGAAMSLDRDLTSLADELTGLLPAGEGRTVGFLRLTLPGLDDEPDLEQGLIDLERDPGDTLIGAAIADLGTRGDFTGRWGEVFGFRDEGAAWGIVALEQEVQSAPLIGTVEEAFNASVEEASRGVDTESPATTPDTSGTSDGGGADGTADGTSDAGGGTDGGTPPPDEPSTPPVTPPVEPPTEPPEVPPPPPAIAPVVEPVVDLVEDLLGGLLG